MPLWLSAKNSGKYLIHLWCLLGRWRYGQNLVWLFAFSNPCFPYRFNKYKQLAKDALSSGDPILSENYLQHADHFSRKLSDLNYKSKEEMSSKVSEKESKGSVEQKKE